MDCHAPVIGISSGFMIDHPKIRSAILALPEVEAGDSEESLAFSVRGKGLSWPYLARATPKGRRELVPGVLAVRCRLEKKELLLEAAPEIFFEDDHYRGYPAVLVRLDAVGEAELSALLQDAWRVVAPKSLVKRFDAAG
jgi:hypothetical protein